MDLSKFIRHVEEEGLDVFNIIVHQNDHLIGQKDWKEPKRLDIRSGTKSFTATAVGFAVEEGMFSLEDYVADVFSQDMPEHISENMRKMQLKHLLTMTMGFEQEELMGSQRPWMREHVKDWVKYSLSRTVIYEPGDKFLYNNIGPYLLGVLIQRRAGQTLCGYLKPRLFDKIGIENPEFVEHCPLGYEMGNSGLCLDVYEFSKLGKLYLHDGVWNGERVLPEGWVKKASSPYSYTIMKSSLLGYDIANDNVIGATYGYFFWIGPWGKWYYACGANDQLCVVVPDKHAVITAVGHVMQHGDRTIHLIAKDIIPDLP